MGISRKAALKRLDGLAPRVEDHLNKLADDPDGEDAAHWVLEVRGWIRQIEDLLPQVGSKTSAEWTSKIAGWKARIGEEN